VPSMHPDHGLMPPGTRHHGLARLGTLDRSVAPLDTWPRGQDLGNLLALGLAAQRVDTPLRTRLHPIRVVAALNRQKHGEYDADSDRRFGCIPKVRRAPRLAGAVLQMRLRNQMTQ
jgi:hypothetical protein